MTSHKDRESKGYFWPEPDNGRSVSVDNVTFDRSFVKRIIEESERILAFETPLPITDEEWITARLSPRCIVENYYFADVGIFIAPGGTGKTTLILYEAIHIALGMPLFGLKVVNSGPVAIVTAEDSREMLVARLRSISQQMSVTDEQRRKIMSQVRISDVSGKGFKLTALEKDSIRTSAHTDRLINGLKAISPVIVFVDPAVSFGVGESRVNDAEQGLVEAGRRIRNEIDCAVIYVHHTGKQNAIDRSVHQYSGRGGSAFADGSRMVKVLQVMQENEWMSSTRDSLEEGQVGLRLARPKLSHARPQPDIFIKRDGYLFLKYEKSSGDFSVMEINSERILKIIDDEISSGRHPTQNSIMSMATGMTNKQVRDAVRLLKERNVVVDESISTSGRGGARSYLCRARQ